MHILKHVTLGWGGSEGSNVFWEKNNPITAATHLVTILVSDYSQINNNKQ